MKKFEELKTLVASLEDDMDKFYNKQNGAAGTRVRKAMQDLKARQLRVNKIVHPANLYACLRFMSRGFKPPPLEEVRKLLKSLQHLESWRFDRSVVREMVF